MRSQSRRRGLVCLLTMLSLTLSPVAGLGAVPGAPVSDAFRTSGSRAVPYMEPDAFSPDRLAQGKAAFRANCALCHSQSGREMVIFGEPDFNAARVSGSVKKFAGAMQDPEIGEKVYEFLRWANPGPYMNQHEPFLQPGPLPMAPGVNNPILTDPEEFWGALTGHRVPTPEDVDIEKVWNSYEWPQVVMPFRMMSWSQFMPHSVALPAVRAEVAQLLAKQKYDLSKLPLDTRGFGSAVNSGVSRIYTKYQFTPHAKDTTDHSRDNVEAMYAASFFNWLSVQDFDFGMPQWTAGQWNGGWAFGPYENPILWKAGTALDYMDIFAVNRDANKRFDSRQFNRHQWTYYPNMFVTGKGEVWKPSKYFNGATLPWACRAGDTGRFGGADAQILTGLKHFAEFWNHSQTYPGKEYPGTKGMPNYGDQVRRYLLAIFTPYQGMQNHRRNREVMVNPLLEMTYRQWQASIGATDQDLRSFYGTPDYEHAEEDDQKRWKALASTYSLLQGVLTDRQKDFVRAYVRRLYPDDVFTGVYKPEKWDLLNPAPDRPVLLPFGSDTAVAGAPYRLRVLRAQAVDGDIAVTAEGLPEGAELRRSAGKWADAAYDYAIEWLPAAAQAGNTYTVTLEGSSNLGTDRATATIRVLAEPLPPILDDLPDRYVFAGQELSFPLTVGTYEGEDLSFSRAGPFGQVINNAWNTAGIFTVRPGKADIGVQRVTFTVTDSRGRSSTATGRIFVYDNDPPVASVSPIGSGPGSNKNIYRARVGETLKLTIDAFDPDGDPVEITKNPDFPGQIKDGEYTYTVEEDVAANFPGPNVLTFVVKDVEPQKNNPANPKHKGGEVYKVLLVYFETADAGRNHTPWAVTGPHQIVKSGSTVTLDASPSDDTDRDPISYHWEQAGGPSVQLSDPAAIKPVFVAPVVREETVLKFHLKVTDPAGLSDWGVARVQVLPAGQDLAVR